MADIAKKSAQGSLENMTKRLANLNAELMRLTNPNIMIEEQKVSKVNEKQEQKVSFATKSSNKIGKPGFKPLGKSKKNKKKIRPKTALTVKNEN